MFSLPALAIGALVSLATGIYGKYTADKQAGEMAKLQREQEKKQEEILKAQGPKATESNETYTGLLGKRGDMFKRGLMSTIKTSNFGLLDTQTAGKTKLGM